MKKNLLFKSIALAMLLLVPFIGNAQRLLTENFEYNEGNLVGQGGWEQTGTTTSFPLQIQSTPQLFYKNYQKEGVGSSVYLDNSGQDAAKKFTIQYAGDIYASVLVNFSEVQSKNNQGDYFFHFAEYHEEEAALTTYFGGRVLVKQNSDGTKMLFGVSKASTSSTTVWTTSEYELNKTHLVVLKYSIIPGDLNDVASIFINPTASATEPEADVVCSDVSKTDLMNIAAIGIRQATGSRSPLGHIGALRVSTTWEGLFDSEGGGEEPDPTPTLTIDPKSMRLQDGSSYNVFVGETYPFSINVKAQNLANDITVNVKGASKGEVTVETPTITKEQAETENGFELKGMLTPLDIYNYIDTIQFISEGVVTQECQIMWTAAETQKATTIADFKAQYAEAGDYASWIMFQITGEVLVNHIYQDNGHQMLYIQDETGGVLVNDFSDYLTTSYAVGDKLSNIIFTGEKTFGTMSILPTKDFGAPLSQGNAVEPVTITLAELKAQGARYEGCLVKVENVTITPSATGNFGDEGTTPIYLKQAEGDNSTLRILPGADFIGKPIPESARSITGISTSSAGTVIAPRNLADIDADFEGGGDPGTDPEEPGNEVEVGENLFLDPSFEAGKSNPILGLTFDDWNVTGAVLESTIVKDGDAAVRITGAGTAKIQQEISALQHTFAEGEAYRLKLNYYVVKSQGDNDVQLQSSWEGVDVVTPQPDDLLQSFSGALSTWENKAIRFVVPAGRQMKFIFKLNVPKNAEVIFDNFGLYKLETIATGIGTTEENILSAWCENGVLCIESNRTESIDVYNLHGMLVNRTTLVPGVNTLNLSAGAYLVKAGTEVMKVLVK